jgi:hypothetical protein
MGLRCSSRVTQEERHMKGMSPLYLRYLEIALSATGLAVILVLSLTFALRQRRYQRIRQELMRWQTLHPDAEPAAIAPLAQPQPDRVAAITLPTQIRLRTRWTQLLVPAICAFGVIDGLFVIPLHRLGGWYQDLLFFGVLDGVILLPAFSAIPFWVIPQQIKVTDDGISLIQSNTPSTILWSEAQLFAVAPVGHTGDEPLYYEISSPTKTIHLVRLRRQTRWFLFPWNVDRAVKPATSFEVYDAQMEALLSLIAAKTNLPLYDLRAV